MDAIEALARNVANARYDDVPDEALRATKNCIIDTLGVVIAGAPECEREVSLARHWGGREESTILVHGGKVPAPNAAWVNSNMASVLDFNDVVEGALHVAVSTVPCALAVSEMKGGINGKEFLTAITAGADAAVRIHLASGNWEVHTSGTTVIFGAAAIAARLLGLDATGVRDAMGIAFTRAAGSLQAAADKVSASKLTFVSRSGIESAILADRGFTGVKNVLQGRYGFFRSFSSHAGNLDLLLDGLGKRFEGTRAVIKKYPSCGTTHTATEATLRIIGEEEIHPEQVRRVTVEVSDFVNSISGHPFLAQANPRFEAQYSLAYCVANAIVRRASLLEHFTEAYVRDPAVEALARKVQPLVRSPGKELAAKVTIETNDGTKRWKEIERHEAVVPSPTAGEEVRKKFRSCAALAPEALKRRKMEEVIDLVDRLEEIDDVCALVKLLV